MISQDTPLQTSSLLREADIEAFQGKLKGNLLKSGQQGYDQARTVWNGMINKFPKLIVQCAHADDVLLAVEFARKYNIILSVRGGGHNVAGNAVCEDGVMIEFSLMKNIDIDRVKQTVRVQPGLTWGELDQATQAFGLATTGGTVSHTGISGLTLGGGLGWLMAKYGLSCDNLLSAEIVTADGKLLTASAGENADLFWAIRGGGGNFGVVTSFEFQLHAVGPTVLGGMVLYPIEQAKEVLQFYREFARSGPDDLIAFASLLTSPEGVPMVAIMAGWFGPLEQGEAYLKPLRSFGPPLVDLIAPIPYLQLQTTFDAAVPFGMHRYWKAGYFQQLTDDLIDTIISHTIEKPSPFSTVVFFHIHGAATRISPQATAFGLRQDQWDIDLISQWRDAEENDLHISWTRRFWKAIEPLSQGVYVNHLDADDGTPRVRAAYQTNYEKLVELKNRYDSTNFFRLNNNIAPTPPS